ncbi:MAG: hypothetical protein JO358_13690 [Alphaproteobacteria bacterium]|nr:hypothetical protein [Alphaproteobacteria bacterium]
MRQKRRGLRTRADRVIADMVQHLGGHLEAIDALSDPEAGAYAVGHHHDDHH